MTVAELIIVAVTVAPLWIGCMVVWWYTMRSRRRSSTPNASVAPHGWHADPVGRYELRYWDGQHWTEHVSRGGVAAVDALG